MLDIVFASFAIWATCRFSAAATAAAIPCGIQTRQSPRPSLSAGFT